MLKLNASYSKKVPAEGDYTSQSYHVSLEVEIPDGISEQDLKTKIAKTFELARESVEIELHGKPNQSIEAKQTEFKHEPEIESTNTPIQDTHEDEPSATQKQISFLNVLCKQKNVNIKTLLARYNLFNAFHLTKRQAAELIKELNIA